MGRASPEYRRLPAPAMRLRSESHRPGGPRDRATGSPHSQCAVPPRSLAFSPCERAPCRLRWDEEGERRFPIVQSYLAQLLEERPGVRPFVRQDEILSAPLVAGLCRLDLHVAAPFRSRCLSKEQTIVGTLAGYWRRINVHQPECEADSASRSGKDPIRFEACCWNSAELASGLHERALARQGAARAEMGSAR